ncbi:MAG: D-tyrosyl-tRNA(Tyr) deacylase [Clostridia bacterium]|nr:D-tyrosyl-tRNA(Tyr) deacylase [Clostridia bacterium]
MRCVVQRVKESSVTVNNETVGAIGPGLMVLIGVSTDDTDADLKYMTDKVPNLRIFDDENGVMNRSVLDVGGSILAVSQFTLYGDARGGRRPSYIRAARPEEANQMYQRLVAAWREKGIHVETGIFRADMQVSLINDGPVTILLDSEKTF